MPISFSVVIPVYNGQKYLRQCINSVLSQTYDKKNFEIIVVDDGSTDGTSKILDQYVSKNQITRIRKEKNGGTASALNLGIKAMKNEWFKWLSADDILRPQALEHLSGHCKNKNTIYYTNYTRIDSNNARLDDFLEPDYAELSEMQKRVILLDHFFGNGSTCAIHKDVFEKCGLFDESVGYQEDYEFWLRASIVYGTALRQLPLNTLQYRIHSGQLTEQMHGRCIKKSSEIRNKVLGMITEHEKAEYLSLLQQHQKSQPIKSKLKRRLRNILYN